MKFNILNSLLIVIYMLLSGSLHTQILPNFTPRTPKVGGFRAVTPMATKTYKSPALPQSFNGNRSQQQMQMVEADMLEAAKFEQQQKAMLQDINLSLSNVQYNLPSHLHKAGAISYAKAFDSLKRMNPDNFSIKRATFIIENAFYDNIKSYSDFETVISNTGKFITQVMKKKGLDNSSNLAKNLTIYQYMSDTLVVGNKKHLPYKYDFNDYNGRKDWNNMFVEKLIRTGLGQCNSLPRYYQILAEEIGAKAHLAFAPNHSFIKFKDQKEDWYNVELTTGAIMTDASMLSSGYIKAEAVINGNYISPQTNRQVMAQLLNDLAQGYISKYGRDKFTSTVVEKSLELYPTGITANMMKNNYKLQQLSFVARQVGAKKVNDLKPFPKAYKMYQELEVQNQKLKDLGFEEMPKERYEAWLSSLKEAKEKQDKQRLMDSFKTSQPLMKK